MHLDGQPRGMASRETWVKKGLVLMMTGNWNLSLLGLWDFHCGEAPSVCCTDRAHLLVNGHALKQSLFGSTYTHTHATSIKSVNRPDTAEGQPETKVAAE